jgi:hypothetical protein
MVANETPLTSRKNMGMIHSSRSLAGNKKIKKVDRTQMVTDLEKERKATLEKRRHGVKKLAFITLSCCRVDKMISVWN